MPGLAASTTQQFLTPLTSLCYQFLKSDQLGTTRKIPSPPAPRKSFARFGEKWMGVREVLNGCVVVLPRRRKRFGHSLQSSQERQSTGMLQPCLPTGRCAANQSGSKRGTHVSTAVRAGRDAQPASWRVLGIALSPWEGASPTLRMPPARPVSSSPIPHLPPE